MLTASSFLVGLRDWRVSSVLIPNIHGIYSGIAFSSNFQLHVSFDRTDWEVFIAVVKAVGLFSTRICVFS